MHRGKVLTNLQLGDNKSLTESDIGQLIFFSSRYFSSAKSSSCANEVIYAGVTFKKSFCSRLFTLKSLRTTKLGS